MPKKRLVILHPEANYLNNPTLYEILRHLKDKSVDVCCLPGDMHYDGSPFINRLLRKLYYKAQNLVTYAIEKEYSLFSHILIHALYAKHLFSIAAADAVVGVDRDGLIQASLIARIWRKRLSLISFEILFSKEVGQAYKQPEIDACKNVKFCIVQDGLRADLLRTENRLNAPLYLLPVSNKGLPLKANSKLRDDLGIPREKKLAIMMGSLSGWSLANDFVDYFSKHADAKWTLIVHERYGSPPKWLLTYAHKHPEKIVISHIPVEFDSMPYLLGGVDVGIALYQPQKNQKYTGLNIQNIGLASGKIACYLRNSLPVITNANGEIAELIVGYDAGKHVTNVQEAVESLDEITSLQGSNARELFSKRLDFDLYKDGLVEGFFG
jgi:hypothetical protein